jgi:putative transport protein
MGKAKLDIDIKIDYVLFLVSLVGFIASVGLIAAKNIKVVINKYGYRFIILAFSITSTGAVLTSIFNSIFPKLNSSIVGTYLGALTSSPGLASALEITKSMTSNHSADVGLGYSIAYIPGVMVVILFAQIIGRKYKEEVCEGIKFIEDEVKEFHILSYMIVIVVGMIIGKLSLKVTDSASLSLGITGGVLFSALFFGNLKKIYGLSFNFNSNHLGVIRDISLSMFLAIVGLNYGYDAIISISKHGVQLLYMGVITGLGSVFVGFIVGKYVLKIDTICLVGGICGGMTSTPGLAAAIEAFDSDEVATAYGATYPFALIFMILFTNLLFIRS